jgi:NAD(P)H-hydrate repair Nnr-like enzyme with NAD(P)H-hydrate dehydratase domain
MFSICLINWKYLVPDANMITAKTTALIMALTIVGAATPAAFATTVPGIGVVTITGQSATNSDDDTNTQTNIFAPEVKSEQKVEQNSGTQNSAFVLNAGTGPNTATQTSTQTVSASQSNTVNDNDEQENNQCATGPSVLNLASCLNIDASLLEALRAD